LKVNGPTPELLKLRDIFEVNGVKTDENACCFFQHANLSSSRELISATSVPKLPIIVDPVPHVLGL